jgi:hypothetical protein
MEQNSGPFVKRTSLVSALFPCNLEEKRHLMPVEKVPQLPYSEPRVRLSSPALSSGIFAEA